MAVVWENQIYMNNFEYVLSIDVICLGQFGFMISKNNEDKKWFWEFWAEISALKQQGILYLDDPSMSPYKIRTTLHVLAKEQTIRAVGHL